MASIIAYDLFLVIRFEIVFLTKITKLVFIPLGTKFHNAFVTVRFSTVFFTWSFG